MALPVRRRDAAFPTPISTDHGRTAVVAWVVVLGAAGLTAVLIVIDLVRRAPRRAAWPPGGASTAGRCSPRSRSRHG